MRRVTLLWSDAFFPGAAVPKLVPAESAGPALPLGSYRLRGDPELGLLKSPETSVFLPGAEHYILE